jgi:hypothetical protein
MTEHNDHAGAEMFYGILKTAYACRVSAVSGHTDDEEIAETLIKHYLRRDPAVRATEDCNQRMLIVFKSAPLGNDIVRSRLAINEALVSFEKGPPYLVSRLCFRFPMMFG